MLPLLLRTRTFPSSVRPSPALYSADIPAPPGHTVPGVSTLDKPKYRNTVEDLRLSPELRLCPKFDAVSIANFPVASLDKMGVRVADNCAEEHIM